MAHSTSGTSSYSRSPLPEVSIEDIIEYDRKCREYREKLTIVYNPFETLWVFGMGLFDWCSSGLRFTMLHPMFSFLVLPLFAGWLALERFPEWEVTKTVDRFEFMVQYVTWWTGLGILSSIGFGTGFQSGLLFLFPHIAKVCLAAQACRSTNFEHMTDIWFRSSVNAFKCVESTDNSSNPVPFFEVWKMIILPCFLQAAGTAIGEIPPFWIARAARLSAQQAGEDQGILPEELECNSQSPWINKAKGYLFKFLQTHGFLGVLLMASWPNLAFDLCGICCGHFLMQFRVFFTATFIGKVFVRNSYQSVFYVALCSEMYIDRVVKALQAVTPDWLNLDHVIHEAIRDCQTVFKGEVSSTNGNNNALGAFWKVLMAVFISLFVLSCIQQLAQYYQFTLDEAESQIMRESLPEHIKNILTSPNSGKIRLIRARNIFKQFHPSRPVSPRKRPGTPVDSFSQSAELLSSRFIPMTPPFEAKPNRIFWQGRMANSKVVEKTNTPTNRPRWSQLEINLLKTVRERLGSKLSHRPQYPEVVGDRKLIRFIRGHEDNIDRVCQKVEKYLLWREENNVDNVRRQIVEGGINCMSKFPHAHKIIPLCPVLLIDSEACSLQNDPVCAEGFLPPEIWDHVSVEEYLEFRLYCLETMSLVLEQISESKENVILSNSFEEDVSPYGVMQQVQVLRDVSNISYVTFTGKNKEAFEKATKLSTDNYPELLLRAHIVNAPWVFGAIWNIAKLFLPQRTIEKVSMSGTDFLEQITKEIPLSSIPDFLGGQFIVNYDKEYVFGRASPVNDVSQTYLVEAAASTNVIVGTPTLIWTPENKKDWATYS